VAHQSGYIHSMFPEATIDKNSYDHFRDVLHHFLENQVDYEIFINFLRDYSKYQKLFQVSYPCHGFTKYIVLEKAFSYEHGSKNRLGEKAGRKLLCEMEEEDFYLQPIDARFIIDPDDELFKPAPYQDFLTSLYLRFPKMTENKSFINDFKKFIHTVSKLPSTNSSFTNSSSHHLIISSSSSGKEVTDYLARIRHLSPTADLAFYAGRHMDSCDWQPFLKAAFERNPVSISFFKECDLPAADCQLQEWPNESIYDGNRLALPDEVVNYRRGDGIEKAITLVNLAGSRHMEVRLEQQGQKIFVKTGNHKFEFHTLKTLTVQHVTL
jgi:hypothetical protein